ncbi:MAG: lytic transglycosylase domain-containing protein [Burkholderiales bacterium]
MFIIKMRQALFVALLSIPNLVHADCWDDAEARYSVSKYLLLAIAQYESGLDPDRVNRNRNGSYDIGLMQINSAWLPALKPFGIGAAELKNPCVNLNVGAWILGKNFLVYGKNWRAVGAYNAKTEWKRASYAHQIAHKLQKIALKYGIDKQR